MPADLQANGGDVRVVYNRAAAQPVRAAGLSRHELASAEDRLSISDREQSSTVAINDQARLGGALYNGQVAAKDVPSSIAVLEAAVGQQVVFAQAAIERRNEENGREGSNRRCEEPPGQ